MKNFKSKISRFLPFGAILFAALLLTTEIRAQSSAYPQGDGKIRIFNYHLNEFGEFQFRKDGKLLPEVLAQMNQLLRSRDGAGLISIDPRLWDLIDFLQDHFQADTFEIISGYRSKEFNASLLQGGHKVSPVSLHMKGQAIDIHIDEIKEETLRDYLLGLSLGGVGYYGPLDFIHIDVGAVKTWSEGENAPRKLVGILDPSAPVQLTSDKNDYLPAETLNFTWTFDSGWDLSKVQEIKLERFWRGKWVGCASNASPTQNSGLPTSALACPRETQVSPSSYGKYRWTFKLAGKDGLLSSNEFYLKKL